MTDGKDRGMAFGLSLGLLLELGFGGARLCMLGKEADMGAFFYESILRGSLESTPALVTEDRWQIVYNEKHGNGLFFVAGPARYQVFKNVFTLFD